MEVRFYVVRLNGESVTTLSEYEDAIFGMLDHVADEKDEVILGDDWFSLSRVPTLEEILLINRRLAELGLAINV